MQGQSSVHCFFLSSPIQLLTALELSWAALNTADGSASGCEWEEELRFTLPLRLIKSSKKSSALAEGALGVVRMICDLSSPSLEGLQV